MGIKLGSKPIIAFKGDHEPVNMAKGNTRVTGWRRELLSGTELSFYNTYKDSVSLSIEGNTSVSDEVYREKTGKTVVIPANEHKKSNADKVLISGNTVQMSDWYGVDGESTQYQDTKVKGKNLLNMAEGEITVNGLTLSIYGGLVTVNGTSTSATRISLIGEAVYSTSGAGIGGLGYTVDVETGTTYTASSELVSGSVSIVPMITYLDSTFKGILQPLVGETRAKAMSEDKLYGVYLQINSDGAVFDNYKFRVQLEKNTVATPYEPYKDTVKNGLVLEYNGKNFFNNPQTTSLKDRSGNGNHGTPHGFAYNSTSGSDGNGGIVFDGVDDYIELQSNLGLIADEFTVNIVCKPEPHNTTNPRIFSLIDGSNNIQIGQYVSTNRVYFRVDNSPRSTTSSYSWGSEMNISVTYNRTSGERNIYINGVKEVLLTQGISDNTTFSAVGSGWTSIKGAIYKGSVSQVLVYNRVLSESEIYQNYMAGTSLNMPSPEDPSPVVSNLPAGTYKYTSTDGVYEFTLDEELRGVGDVTDKVVFDRVSHKGLVSRRLKSTLLDGSESWGVSAQANDDTLARFVRQIPDLIPNYHYNIQCNILPLNDKTDFALTNKECVSTHTTTSSGQVNIWVKKSRLSTVDAISFKEWLSNNSGILIYEKSESRVTITFTKVSSSTAPEVPMQFITSEVSPDYPAEMYDVEGVKIATRTKNILDASKFQNCRADTVSTWDGTFLTITGNWYDQVLIKVKPNTNYKLSYTKTGDGRSSHGVWTTSNGVSIVKALSSPSGVFNSGDNTELLILLYSGSGTPMTSVYSNIQVEEGSTATSHELESFRSEVTTPLLRKVGTVADTYNPLTGEYVQRVGVKVFDGSEVIGSWSDILTFETGFKRVYYGVSDAGKFFSNDLCLSSHFKAIDINGVAKKVGVGQVGVRAHDTTPSGTYVVFGISDSLLSAPLTTQAEVVSAVKSWMMSHYNNGTPIKLIYQLETPIVTYLEPKLIPLYDVDTYIESDSSIVQPDITVGYELKDGVTTNINDITEPHPDYPRVIDGVGEYDAVNDDYNLEVYSGVGGRNLLPKSQYNVNNSLNGYEWTFTSDIATTMSLSFGSNNRTYYSGDYVLSFDAKVSDPEIQEASVRLSASDTDGVLNLKTIGYVGRGKFGSEWSRINHFFTLNSPKKLGLQIYNHSFNEIFNSEVSVKNIKIEQGTQATPWTPAPEDIQYNTPTNNTFKTLHNFPVEMNRVGDVADEYTPPFWGAGYDGDGRNLLSNSLVEMSRTGNTAHFGYPFSALNLEEGSTVTVSFDAKSDLDNFTMDCYLRHSTNSASNMVQRTVNTVYSRYSVQLKVPTDTVIKNSIETVRFRPLKEGTLYIRNVKVERGSSPTPWTPSSGEFVQRIGKKVFDGTEEWAFSQIDQNTARYLYEGEIGNDGVDGAFRNSSTSLNSHFKIFETAYQEDKIGQSGSTANKGMYVRVPSSLYNSARMKDWVRTQYINGTPLTIYYVKRTPILSTITGSAIPTFFPATKVETLTAGAKPKLQGTARVVDLLESDF